MKNSAWLIVLIAAVALFAITGAAQPALAQHHGHIGGSGIHGGGFHGGGFHSGAAFPGGFHAGHPGGFHGGVGFPTGVHPGYWRGGYWGYPRYGYGWGFGIGFGIGIGIGWGAYWPYPYYGYAPNYAYPYLAYPGPLYYPPYPYPYYPYPHYPYYRYYPLSRPYVYSGADPDHRNDESPAVQRHTIDSSNDNHAEYQVVDARLQQFPPERRRVVQNVVRALRAMPPDARQRQINAGRFGNLSPEEQELLKGSAPVSAAWAQPQSVPRPRQQSALLSGR